MSGRWLFCSLLLLLVLHSEGSRYAFYQSLRLRGGRRIFGGSPVMQGLWPNACALLDRGFSARCSCSVLAPFWALTAAHCVTPKIAMVQFRDLDRDGSNIVSVKLLYAHPEYRVVEKDMGQGLDVATLHNDVGLVRTRGEMTIPQPHINPLEALSRYTVQDIMGEDIKMLGFGMTEDQPAGERLREVQLRLVSCERQDWLNCACAIGPARGVCSGDSGGPVFYKDAQIGVTSMGPVECGVAASQPALLPGQAMSVFTAVQPYAALINATMHDVDYKLRMRVVPSAAAVTQLACLVRASLLIHVFHMCAASLVL